MLQSISNGKFTKTVAKVIFLIISALQFYKEIHLFGSSQG